MIRWLAGEQTAAYVHLTTEAVGSSLARVQAPRAGSNDLAGDHYVAAGMSFAGLPAALAVLRLEQRSASSDATLLSLVVTPQLQRLGLARELMQWLFQQSQQLGWAGLSVSYPRDHSCTVAMHKLTKAEAGWKHTAGLLLLQLDRSGAARLLERLDPLLRHAQRSDRFKLTAWQELPPAQRNNLGPALKAPFWAWPSDDQGHDPLQVLDPVISTVLLDHQQTVGWLTAHRVGPRLFRVSQWWVRPSIQGTGAALLLLHRAVKGALLSPVGYEVGTFGMEPGNTMAVHFCERKIAPLAAGISRQCRAYIPLRSAHPT